MNVFEKIEAQQKGKENTAVWMVGEQLKDICRREPACADIVDADMENKDMSLANCEKQIKKWADGHKKGNCAVVPPNVAEGIIREFFGLPKAGEAPVLQLITPVPQPEPQGGGLSLDDFLV